MSFKDLLAATVFPATTELLGEEAVYQTASDDSNPPEAFSVRGIWSGPHQAMYLSTEGPEYSTTQPSFSVRLSDFDETPKQGDGITIFATDYEVIDVQPDGQGMATLILEKA